MRQGIKEGQALLIKIKGKLLNTAKKITEKIVNFLPDKLTGESKILELKYRGLYGSRDCTDAVYQRKHRTASLYLAALVLFIAGVFILYIDQVLEPSFSDQLTRPEKGQVVKNIQTKVHITYKDVETDKIISLKIKEKELSEREAREQLNRFKDKLGTLILGNNENLMNITGPLRLIDRDITTGITIDWMTDNPKIINENGDVDLINGSKARQVRLEAKLALEEVTDYWSTVVRIRPDLKSDDYERTMAERLTGIVKELNRSTDNNRLILPDKLEDGIQLKWEKASGSNWILIIFIFIFANLIIYFKRFDVVNKEVKRTSESIASDLPEFINKLVLLLNAGLVVSTALSKIAEDYQNNAYGKKNSCRKWEKGCLYEELSEIEKRVKQTNSSMIKELKEYARRSGVRELMRVTAIISDNLNKGSALAEKLEAEAELLWITRKKRAEEKGRLAETKLTLPMMILLIITIIVTIAPALIEM